MTKSEAIVKAPERRVRRSALTGRAPLRVTGKEPGFEYRVVNDDPGRIAQFQEAGWEIVPAKDVQVGDKRVDKPSIQGSATEIAVGKGVTAVLMRQREDWFKEDQAAKQEYVNATEAATKQEAENGTYGKLDISRS